MSVMTLQVFFAAGLLFVALQIAILAGTYSTTDALGPLAFPVFLFVFYAVPAAAIGCVIGGLAGAVVGVMRSWSRT